MALLVQEIEKEKERMQRGESVQPNPEANAVASSAASQDGGKDASAEMKDAEGGDIKTEENVSADKPPSTVDNAVMSVDS